MAKRINIKKMKLSKPVRVKFHTKPGALNLFKGKKKVTKPVRVKFYAKDKSKTSKAP